MITKYVLAVLFLSLETGVLYCQNKEVEEKVFYYDVFSPNKKVIESRIYYDVENLSPVYRRTIDTAQSSKANIFYYWGKKSEVVSTDLDYIGGTEALLNYQDSLYFQRPNYIDCHINGYCIYTILFDENLKIREVKIIRRSGYENTKYNFDDLIKKILLSTEGNWEILRNSAPSKWYLRLGKFLVR